MVLYRPEKEGIIDEFKPEDIHYRCKLCHKGFNWRTVKYGICRSCRENFAKKRKV